MESFAYMTSGWTLLVCTFFVSVFMSRERFWHYAIGNLFAYFMTSNMKLIFHDPRPIDKWADIWLQPCKPEFGSPSMHCSVFSAVLFLILFDHFTPSTWSRTIYPDLNKRTIHGNLAAFVIALALNIIAQLILIYDRMLLGMHTLDQVLFGALFGLWCAAFCHICLRDRIFSHISRISNCSEPLTGNQTLTYALKALSITLVAIFTTVCVSVAVQHYGRIDIRQATNKPHICDIDIPSDTYLIKISEKNFRRPIVLSTQYLGLFSFYLGQLLFRYTRRGYLGNDAFNSSNSNLSDRRCPAVIF